MAPEDRERLDRLLDKLSEVARQQAEHGIHIIHIREAVEVTTKVTATHDLRLSSLEQAYAKLQGALGVSQTYIKLLGLLVSVLGVVEGASKWLH